MSVTDRLIVVTASSAILLLASLTGCTDADSALTRSTVPETSTAENRQYSVTYVRQK